MDQIGGNTNEWATVIVTREEHAMFDGTRNATRADVENAARKIYADYPEILGALG